MISSGFCLGDRKSWWLDLEVALDHATGRVLWTFRSLDPQTGELPTDALAGFLPPNDATGRGQGQVAFAIRPQPGTPDGTPITNSASIVFDLNEPVVTNQVWNTIGQPGPMQEVYLPLVLCWR